MLISSTADLLRSGFILLSGPSGIGKTQMAATFPDPSRTLFIDMENGALTVKDAGLPYLNVTQDDKGQTVPRAQRFRKLMEVFKWLNAEKRDYDYIFVDSLNEIAQCLFEDCKLRFPDKGDKFKIWEEYGMGLQDLIKGFRDMTKYKAVVMTILTEEQVDDFKQKFYSYQVKGQMKDQIAGFFDMVFFMTTDKDGKRWIKTKLTNQYTAKDRTKALNEAEEPNFKTILGKTNGKN